MIMIHQPVHPYVSREGWIGYHAAIAGGRLWLRQADRGLDPQGVAILSGRPVAARPTERVAGFEMTYVSLWRLAANDRPLARMPTDVWRSRLAGAFQDFFRFEFRAAQTVGVGDVPRLEDEPAVLNLLTKGWAGFVAGHGQAVLESTLPDWLLKQRWFGAKTRKIHSVKVLEWVELPVPLPPNTEILPAADLPADSSIPTALFYFEVNYGENACDVYQVPLAFSTGETAARIQADRPLSILASLPGPAAAESN